MFGMSSKEFWEDDPQLYWAYQTFYLEKQKQDFDRNNQYMWLQGMYIYEGVSVALHNLFSKTSKTYTSKPYDLGISQNQNEKVENESIDEKVMKINNSWSRLI